MSQISYFLRTTDTEPYRNGPIINILNAIRDGLWKQQIEKLRSLPPEQYKEGKLSLSAVTFCGSFSKRNAESLLEYSKHIVIDIDHVQLSQIKAYKEAFKDDPYIYSTFVSPSGEGLKILFKLDCDKEGHLAAFLSIKKYLEDKYAMNVDKTGKDICRLCYVSYDPDLYLNPNALLWTDFSAPEADVSPIDLKAREIKFTGKKVSADVQYIFNVAKKWVDTHWTFAPGAINNYLYGLSCILNRCGVIFNDTMFLLENNFITPDNKWHQSVRSAYFHNKHEHNTVKIYELESGVEVKPLEEEKPYSENVVENDIITQAVKLLNKNVNHIDVKEIIKGYASFYNSNGLTNFSDDKVKELLSRAYNNSEQAKVADNSLKFMSSEDMLHDILVSHSSETITTGMPEFDLAMGGGLLLGNFYGLIGLGMTFKSILAQSIAAENAKKDIPVLFLNSEMSSRQFFERLMNKELRLSYSEEVASGRLNPSTSHLYSEKLKVILKNNLFVVNGTNISETEILNTIETIRRTTGKTIRLLICDGITQLLDTENNEILSAPKQTAMVKEVSKKLQLASIGLMHVSGTKEAFHRNTAKNARGGQKTIANMDGYFCTSLYIDPATLDHPNDDILYKRDKFHLRFVDKRGSGEETNKTIVVSKPLSLSCMDYDPSEHEVDMSGGKSK